MADKEVTNEELERLLKERRDQRLKECGEKILAILKEYQCEIVPDIHIVGDKIDANVTIRPTGG